MPPTNADIHIIDPAAADLERLATLWSRDLPLDLPVSPRLLAWCLAPHPGRTVALLVQQGREIQAYAIVSKMEGSTLGVVDVLVTGSRGARATSLELVRAAEDWLRTQSATAIQFGGGPYSLLRGIPASPRRPLDGWTGGATRAVHDDGEFDLALDVSRYTPPSDLETVAGVVQPAQARDRDELTAFFAAPAFLQVAANNAPATIEELALPQEIAFSGRTSDLMLLFTARGVEGLCQVVFTDSTVPIEVAYPYTLAKPWGGIGAVLVTERLGNAAVALLLDAAIRRLHNNGVNACVALGVSAPLIYTRFGFVEHRTWRQRVRAL